MAAGIYFVQVHSFMQKMELMKISSLKTLIFQINYGYLY